MSIVPGILQKHLEEFQFLCGQYEQALQSPDYQRRDLDPLERRIAAHLDGILVAGDAALPLLEAGLAADEPQAAFAAAYILMRINAAGGKRVLNAFLQAKEGQLDGICRALCHSLVDEILDPLRQAVASSAAPIAAAAAEVLAFHHKLGPSAKRLSELLLDDDPAVRSRAWRATSRSGMSVAR